MLSKSPDIAEIVQATVAKVAENGGECEFGAANPDSSWKPRERVGIISTADLAFADLDYSGPIGKIKARLRADGWHTLTGTDLTAQPDGDISTVTKDKTLVTAANFQIRSTLQPFVRNQISCGQFFDGETVQPTPEGLLDVNTD